ncbi:hypothetical protein [Limimaricola pyoseonensis]|uniref:hypothetical protein n=1 Tax=Limimaricola pyoseonensis TaxID=521013 RepID=UPI001042040D|nr:hypothetical protein [Limimaricola pyoseonensis]
MKMIRILAVALACAAPATAFAMTTDNAPTIICLEEGCPDGPIVHLAVDGRDGGCTEFDEELLFANKVELHIETYGGSSPDGREGGIKATLVIKFS